ncbi:MULTISPECIES: hypothetical protein [unclassified Methanoregula]|uniref:hypothetical protein n=1 Tax=unclassified Methanoregula TaxID=2649730 RepID=UPI0009D400EE|nr:MULTISPECIES: hypothetical protein [unclassified Methanoregula]OPX62860.1 MAG: hypothetical protein A4E33_01989 [Methanoregula sp. PtaB.Bin085]OPY35297.1 MAG: hypothetical protein A4E34_00825 [Methanoregula sp. PtaU1.Bin006]
MCSPVGPLSIELGEITFYKYRCNDCGREYKSTGKQHSICPDCKSENVEKV